MELGLFFFVLLVGHWSQIRKQLRSTPMKTIFLPFTLQLLRACLSNALSDKDALSSFYSVPNTLVQADTHDSPDHKAKASTQVPQFAVRGLSL